MTSHISGGFAAARTGALGALAFGAVSGALLQTLVLPLLPLFPEIFSVDIAAASWIATASMLVGALSAPLLGWVGDRFGLKETVIGVLIAMGIGAVISALSQTLAWMLFGRVLQGFAIGIVGLSIALLRHIWPKERLSLAVGILSGSVGVGTALGVPFAGLIVAIAPWQSVFWIMAAAAFGSALLIALIAPRPQSSTQRRFDWLGALGLGAVVTLLLLAPSWLATAPLTAYGMWALSALGGLLWFTYQTRISDPFVDTRLLRSPALLSSHVVALLLGFGFFLSFTATISLAQLPSGGAAGLGGTVLTTGWVQLPASISAILCPIWAGRLAQKHAPIVILRGAIFIALLGFLLRSVFLTEAFSLSLATALVSGAISFAFAVLPMVLMQHSPLAQTASVNGINMLFRQIGASLASMGGALLLARFIDFSKPAEAIGFYWLFGLGAAACAAALLILSLTIRKT